MQPDMASMAWHALTLLLEPARLGILVIGVLIGLAIGVLPGLNGIVGMAMLIPFTYNMDPPAAMALLIRALLVQKPAICPRSGNSRLSSTEPRHLPCGSSRSERVTPPASAP